MGGEVGKLVLDGLWMKEIVLAEQLDEVARLLGGTIKMRKAREETDGR